MIGTSSAKNRDFVLKNGPDIHIDYNSQDFVNVVTDVDLVLDTVGGDNVLKSVKVTKAGGKVITITSGNIPQEYLDEAAKRNVLLSFSLLNHLV